MHRTIDNRTCYSQLLERVAEGDFAREVAARQNLLWKWQCERRLSQVAHIARRKLDRPVPDFLIIGAAKTGTTSLFQTLQGHPSIARTLVKEPDFFSVDQMYREGLQWYRSLFCDSSAEELTGEASTSYSRLPLHRDTAARVFAANPNAKIIYLTRDPITRCYSHMLHRWYRELFRDRSFDVEPSLFLAADCISLTSSCYDEQLKPWRDCFPESQIHVTSFEAVLQDPREEISRICAFLGISALENFVFPAENVSSRINRNLRATALVHKMKSTFVGGSLARILPSGCRRWIFERVLCSWQQPWRKAAPNPPLDLGLRNEIDGLLRWVSTQGLDNWAIR